MLSFNSKPVTKLHLDINSCFATIEQQANPLWRGKPVVVAAYAKNYGAVLAASREAKQRGVRTGMLVKDARNLIPGVIVREPDANKYRDVHLAFRKLLGHYSDRVVPKSIDEFVVDFEFTPLQKADLMVVGQEIKRRIKSEIGDWITVSVGVSTSRWLAKQASNLRKPDGLELINAANFDLVYKKLKLVDLSGIKRANSLRLHRMGIYTVWDFYQAPLWKLRAAFQSVVSSDWYFRIRGYEVDDVEFGRRSYGNSYVLPQTLTHLSEISPVLSKLVTKMSFRMRRGGYSARGVWLGVGVRPIRWDLGRDGFWHRGMSVGKTLIDSNEIFGQIYKLLLESPYQNGVKSLAVSCFGLERRDALQLELFQDVGRKNNLTEAIDDLNKVWGLYTVYPARMVKTEDKVPDRIAFGGVKELEELVSPI